MASNLLGRVFTIYSDQRNLKEIWLQVIQTPDQQFYNQKLMGYKFDIEYKAGASNRAASALSQRECKPDPDANSAAADTLETEPPSTDLFPAFTRPLPSIFTAIRVENNSLDHLRLLHAAVATDTTSPHISVHDGLLYYKSRLYISPDSPLFQQLLHEYHASLLGGH